MWYTPQMSPTGPHAPVTSRENSVVKQLRSLADAKHRNRTGSFIIEGVKMVEEALRDRAGVKMVAAAPSLTRHHGRGIIKLAGNEGVDILWISERLMSHISESKTPQPVMAVVGLREHSDESLLSSSAGPIVFCCQIQDPGNLGTIIRTAEAAGAAGVAISPNTVDPYNAKAVRASMGSILRVPVAQTGEAMLFLEKCRLRGLQAVALTPAGERTHFDLDLTRPSVLFIGREGAGLPETVLNTVDLRVRIPMANSVDSLNVATSVAVVLYEALRQREKG